MTINIQSLFADIIDTPEQRQAKLLQQGMAQGQLLSSGLTGLTRAAAPLAQVAGQLGVQRQENLRRAVQPMLGLDPRTTGEKMAEQLKGLNPEDPNSLLQAAQALQSLDPVRAAALRQAAAQKTKENEDRKLARDLQTQQLKQAEVQTKLFTGEEADAALARAGIDETAKSIEEKDPLLAAMFKRRQISANNVMQILEQQEKNKATRWGVVNSGLILNTSTGETQKVDDLRIQSWIQTTDNNGNQRIVGLTADPSNPVAINIAASDLPNLMSGQSVPSTIEGDGSISAQGAINPEAEPPALLQPTGAGTSADNGQVRQQGQQGETRKTMGAVPYDDRVEDLAKYEDNISAIYKAKSILEDSVRAAGIIPEVIRSLGSAPVEAMFLQPERDLKGVIEPLEANLAFDRLELMRQRSKTGGALGNVSDRELSLLKATVASLSTLQDPELIMDALDRIENHYTNFLALELGAESGLSVRINEGLYQNVKVQNGRVWFREIDDNGDEQWYTEEPITELKIESIK